ncbi:MAG: chloramphenicol acetyltransferase [Acidimicrobiales bacterium]|nr:MAG: chloramphenicol acetyltransferase [Acidimicrobiales bacterium]
MSWEEMAASGRLAIGRYSYGRPTIYVYPGDTGRVSIGSFVSIAHGVEIFLGGNHRTDWISTFPFRFVLDLPGALEDGLPASKGEVVIGSDVWIGKGAKILSGACIGNGAVIGAYSVVAKDVAPYAIVVGSPAREIKRRFEDETIDTLQRIKWWDWPIEKIRDAVPLLCSPDIEAFLCVSIQDRTAYSSTYDRRGIDT